MRVLVVIFEELYPLSGGGSPRISNIIRAFSRQGHRVAVAAGIGRPEEEARAYLGCEKIVRLKSVSRLDPGKMKKYLLAHPVNILRTIKAIGRFKPDLVVSHNTIAGYGALWGRRLSRKKPLLVLNLTDVLFEYLGDYSSRGWLKLVQQLGRKIETRAIRGSDRIITISRSMREIVAGYGGRREEIDIVCDGVDLEIFRRYGSGDLRQQYAAGMDTVVVFQGVIDPQDGPELLVAAAGKVLEVYPRTSFWVIGGGTAIGGLKNRVEDARQGDNFYFSGWVPQEEVARYLSAGDIGLVILPDILSARGRVTLKEFEYWACGLAVVAPRLPALQEVIAEGQTGLFYRPGDEADLAEKIKQLISQRSLARKMGEEGLKLVGDRYRWNHLADHFVRLCQEYVAAPSTANV